MSFKGTPNWMAPETVKNMEYTRFSDIWAIGCTVIEMATGEPPWSECNHPMTVLYKIMESKEPPKIPENLSAECKDFISHCLKYNKKIK
jgi:mitogen-activated protein kinase kinase kinase